MAILVGRTLGPFVVEKEIGSGAMGTVYRARYAKNNQPVALKVISLALDSNPTSVARFERECAILKKLNHPNIVRLYATGRYHGTPFYVMEFVEGQSLEAVLQRRRLLPWQEVVHLGKQVCAALQHAHDQGIIHRDLKPANIMVTGDGTVKLTDFGIAKGLESTQLTATNHAIGTAAYMSPEQCRGERDLTSKADIYALGVLFYELLTGRRPFLAETTMDMFLAHTQGKFERPSRLVLDIPVYLDTLVCQMLEKEPHKRPLNASMVAQSLDRVLDKMATQRSVGVDAVSKSAAARELIAVKTDETDKETLRHLRAATTVKKRLKKKAKPLYERGWFVILMIALFLGAIGWTTWRALRPPSLEELVRETKVLMDSSDRDNWDKARDGPIAKFFSLYATRTDEPALQMRMWADQIDLAQRERQFRNRLRYNMSAEGQPEQLARAGTRQAEAGDLGGATESWESLLKYKDNPDQDEHVWGLLAEKRLETLHEVPRLEAKIREHLQEEQQLGKRYRPDSDPEQQAALAIRLQRFKDSARALRVWRRLKDTGDGSLDQSPWRLLAAKKVAELTPKVPRGADEDKERLRLINARLVEAQNELAEHPQEAVLACEEIVLLYGKDDDPDVAGLVKSAQTLLKQISVPSHPPKPAPPPPP